MTELDRRRFAGAAGGALIAALAGCTAGGSGDGGDGGTETVVDETGADAVTVRVGARGNGGYNAFAPANVRVSPGMTVTWQWTGKGVHNVVARGGEFNSGPPVSDGSTTFEHAFEESGTYRYYCAPHRQMGMKGKVVVEK